MLFPSASIKKLRQELFAQMEAGDITREQVFQKALELDPLDAVALTFIGEERYKADDLAGAAEYCWRAVHADSCRYEAWFKLSVCLVDESQDFRDGLMELGARKALRDPEGPAQFEESLRSQPNGADFGDGEAFLATVAEQVRAKRRGEPEEVSRRLRPYRLVDELLENAGEGLDAELVAGILEEGVRCRPLLVGVLRAMATGSLPGGDPSPIVSSLALLGERGDPAVLPEVIECVIVDDPDVREAVHWAVRRIAASQPEASLDVVRKLALTADAARRSDLAVALCHFPAQPGKRDALVNLLDGLAAFPKPERCDLFIGVVCALVASEGREGRALAWSLLGSYRALLPKRARVDLQAAIKVQDELDRMARERGEGSEITVYDICALGTPAGQGDEDDDDDFDDDGDDYDDEPGSDEDAEDGFVPEPVRRGVILGRNDSCWCGSGKKYKKCHLDSDEIPRPDQAVPEPASPPTSNAEEAGLRRRLVEFATETLRKRGVEEALRKFVGPEPPAGTDDDSLSRESLDWLVHDYVPPRLGHPLIQEFLKRGPGGLNLRQRKILEAWSRSRFSLFEVQEVRPGFGVRLKDLLVGGEFFVYDVRTSHWAVRWDCCLARVEEFEERHEFTAIVLCVPPPAVAPLKDWAVEAQRRSGIDWDAFLHANSHKLRQEASRLFNLGADSTRIVSPEGDELDFSRARYVVLDEAALRRALDQSAAFHRDPDPAGYAWLDAENAAGARRLLGSLRIAGGELTVECFTRARLQRGRGLLHDLAAAHLRHLKDDFSSWQSAIRGRKSSPGSKPPSGLPPEAERELIGKMLGEHYDRWLDMPLPALDGRTPRQAVATPAGRAQVVEVLKRLENGEERKRRDGHPWYDCSKLKTELGVEF